MSISVAAVIISVIAFGLILIFLKYLFHKDNMRHINRGGQIEMMVGRQVILEGRLLGYQNQNHGQASQPVVPPRYEVAVEEAINSIDTYHETPLNHENTRPSSRPPSYESRVFTLQQQ